MTLLAACGSGSASPVPSPAAATPPPALVAALLTVDDVPHRFAVAPARAKPKYAYDPASCGSAVSVGTVVTGPQVAGVEFVDTAAQSRILEVLRHYGDPVPYLKIARAHVSQCPDYTLTDTAGHHTTVHATITTEPTTTGAFVAQIVATGGSSTVDETLAVQQAGQNLIVLAVTGPTPPDSATTTYLVRAAVARAQHA